ncbi:MAG TPA: hypothetical protein PK163_05510 [Steroidobacteraceae bacterium]|nr:hypothetical protein [Steroidobacteraceae bacterium]
MTRNTLTIRSAIALAAMLAAPLAAHAESSFQTGAGALTANARVDFTITIPKVLFLRVGTGTNNATNAAIDLITFTVPAANVGNGTPVAATAGSGDLGNGAVTAVVRGNNGNISFSANTAGAMNNGNVTDTINWSEITTTAASLTTATVLAAPTIPNSGATTITLTAVNKVVNQDARWTYAYANSAIVPAGTYGGVNVNNGRVTYTASLP